MKITQISKKEKLPPPVFPKSKKDSPPRHENAYDMAVGGANTNPALFPKKKKLPPPKAIETDWEAERNLYDMAVGGSNTNPAVFPKGHQED